MPNTDQLQPIDEPATGVNFWQLLYFEMRYTFIGPWTLSLLGRFGADNGGLQQ